MVGSHRMFGVCPSNHVDVHIWHSRAEETERARSERGIHATEKLGRTDIEK